MTPHIEAKKEEIAKIVLMPGDPLRAKHIADNYLTDVQLVNSVRNIYAYTGNYQNQRITVMASGMGMPSIGIYSYELYKFYDVDYIIRIGTAGAYTEKLNIFDLVLATSAYSESTFGQVQNKNTDNIKYPSKVLNDKIKSTAQQLNLPLTVGTIHSSDVFYQETNDFMTLYYDYNCLCVEMESFALFHNASVLNKHAACLLTISDSLVTNESSSSEDRSNHVNQMIELALETTLRLE